MGNSKNRVSIIIPHYNQKEYLKVVLPSIANQTFQNYEVIVIDDCTPDKSAVEYIGNFVKEHPNMRLVENAENMRFIKTVNKGIKLAEGDYICFLNSDTEVKNNFVQRNVEIMDADPSIGALSCIIVDQHGSNWWSGGSFEAGFPVNSRDDFQGIRTVDFVAGTAAFYRKEVFDKIGLFDESFGMYHEDVEYGLRIRAETDYKTSAFSDKLVIHYQLNSLSVVSKNRYLLLRNHIFIVRKYCPQLLPIVVLKHSLAIPVILGKDVLGLHPLLFFQDAVGSRGLLAGLLRMPAQARHLAIR